jgi:tetratricopeptide (TPR) repeat protein
MNTKPERLDKDGFPIPGGFDFLDPTSGERSAERPPRGPAARAVLRWIMLAGFLAAAWVYFDVGTRARNLIGDYLCQEGIRQLRRNDLEGALASLDRAVDWAPKNARAVMIRMRLHLELRNWEEALEDSHRAAELDDTGHDWVDVRLRALQGLRRHRDTAAFCSEMLKRGLGERITMLNSRAYARAQGNFELNEALTDIDEAIAANQAAYDVLVGKRSAEEALSMHTSMAALIDTRGYVLLKLDRPKEALADFEKAIGESDEALDLLARRDQADRREGVSQAMIERRAKRFDESRAVMYHHRGEARQKLGQTEQAREDFAEADDLGYDPTVDY